MVTWVCNEGTACPLAFDGVVTLTLIFYTNEGNVPGQYIGSSNLTREVNISNGEITVLTTTIDPAVTWQFATIPVYPNDFWIGLYMTFVSPLPENSTFGFAGDSAFTYHPNVGFAINFGYSCEGTNYTESQDTPPVYACAAHGVVIGFQLTAPGLLQPVNCSMVAFDGITGNSLDAAVETIPITLAPEEWYTVGEYYQLQLGQGYNGSMPTLATLVLSYSCTNKSGCSPSYSSPLTTYVTFYSNDNNTNEPRDFLGGAELTSYLNITSGDVSEVNVPIQSNTSSTILFPLYPEYFWVGLVFSGPSAALAAGGQLQLAGQVAPSLPYFGGIGAVCLGNTNVTTVNATLAQYGSPPVSECASHGFTLAFELAAC